MSRQRTELHRAALLSARIEWIAANLIITYLHDFVNKPIRVSYQWLEKQSQDAMC